MSNIDVLIVGAGPVGLTLALECQRHGVAFRIIDKNPEPSDKSKALAVWSGTIECLAAMGVADDFLSQSMPIHGLIFGDTGTIISQTSVHEDIESVYPRPFLLPQSHTEEILLNYLRQRGAAVERPIELTGMRDVTDGVEATLLHHADGTLETITARYLVGCDGARSYVRHHLPVEFPGVTEDKGFILIDGKVEGDLPDDHIFVNWGPASVCAFFPIKKGVFRLFSQRPDTSNHEPPTMEEIDTCLKSNGLGRIKFYDPEWLAYFGVNERYTSRMRVNRAFLLGDAAHIHSPAGGQGMNTGMQDSFNLGWKLALLTRGKGDSEALTESLHAERHPVAKALIDKTTKMLHAGMANNVFIRAVKDVAVKFVFQSQFVRSKLSGELSELHISYPNSPLVVADSPAWPNPWGFEPGSKPRDAALQHSTTKEAVSLWRQYLSPKHTLVLFSGNEPASDVLTKISDIATAVKTYGDAVQVIVVWKANEAPANLPEGLALYLDPEGKAHDRYGLEQAGWYLVRPDQYLAARAARLETESLHVYLKKSVG